MHVETNDADKVGTTELLESYRQLGSELKDRRVGRIVLSAILPMVGGRTEHGTAEEWRPTVNCSACARWKR